MTAFRLISLPTHAAFEAAAGLALLAAGFVLGLSPAGVVVAVVAGALVVGLALTAEPGRGSVPATAHEAFDGGLVIGLLGAAALLGLTGDGIAAVVLASVGALQLLLRLVTRYSVAT